jgi:hypothetical protein
MIHFQGERHTLKESWGWFHQRFTSSFYVQRSPKHKKDTDEPIFLCFWDLRTLKLHVKRWWNRLLENGIKISQNMVNCSSNHQKVQSCKTITHLPALHFPLAFQVIVGVSVVHVSLPFIYSLSLLASKD